MDIHIIEGVSEDISMKAAYHYMKENNTVTLPILSDGELEDLSHLGIYQNHILTFMIAIFYQWHILVCKIL